MFPARGDEPDPRVVIVGSGFAGYLAARRLQRRLRNTRAQLTMFSATDGFPTPRCCRMSRSAPSTPLGGCAALEHAAWCDGHPRHGDESGF